MRKNSYQKRITRHDRVRSKIFGTAQVPRVSVFKSNRHIFVQFIDDEKNKTILSSKIVNSGRSKITGTKTDKAAAIGKMLADRAKDAGIAKIVFDRGGFKYHGRIKALADELRKGGLQF